MSSFNGFTEKGTLSLSSYLSFPFWLIFTQVVAVHMNFNDEHCSGKGLLCARRTFCTANWYLQHCRPFV